MEINTREIQVYVDIYTTVVIALKLLQQTPWSRNIVSQELRVYNSACAQWNCILSILVYP
jgi:hypothetical protein